MPEAYKSFPPDKAFSSWDRAFTSMASKCDCEAGNDYIDVTTLRKLGIVPEEVALRSGLNNLFISPNLERLVLGCVDAKFCE